MSKSSLLRRHVGAVSVAVAVAVSLAGPHLPSGPAPAHPAPDRDRTSYWTSNRTDHETVTSVARRHLRPGRPEPSPTPTPTPTQPAAATPPASPTSASSPVEPGGADRESVSFTARNGLSSRYHVYAQGVPQPAGLLLQFHGDGAYEFSHPRSSYSLGGPSGIVAEARERGYITVPVLSPDRSGSITWWEDGARNASYVRDLVARLKTEYAIDDSNIWLVGYSGGAQFITQFYLPAHSGTIDGGGAVIFGGGGTPRVRAAGFDADLRADFPMHWYTGANDDGSTSSDGYNALRDAKAGESWYADRGFATSHLYPAGVGHNLSGRFGSVVARQLDRVR